MELRRQVEFLNLKSGDVELLAVEVEQYLASDHGAIEPRVVGLTAFRVVPQVAITRHRLVPCSGAAARRVCPSERRTCTFSSTNTRTSTERVVSC